MLTTDWLIERLPEVAIAMMRSPAGKDMELAEGRDVVDAGIGAGVGEHDEAVANEDSAAIGHGGSRECRGYSRRLMPPI
jgi:hypothetical protein